MGSMEYSDKEIQESESDSVYNSDEYDYYNSYGY